MSLQINVLAKKLMSLQINVFAKKLIKFQINRVVKLIEIEIKDGG